MSELSSEQYLINTHLIEPGLNRITYNEHVHKVEPRVMEVLLLLIKNVGNITSREEIINAVWQDRTVSDSSLNRNIARLRKILDIDLEPKSCIKTIPKRGYLLEADVKLVNATGSQPRPLVESTQSTQELEAEKDSRYIKYPIKNIISISLMTTLSLIVLLYFLIPKDFLIKTDANSNANKPSKGGLTANHTITLSPEDEQRAFCLDGVDDYVELNSNNAFPIGTNDFSISAWVKTDATELVTIADKRDEKDEGDVRGFSLYLNKGFVGFQLADGKGDWYCSSEESKSSCSNYRTEAYVADDKWHLITVAVDRDHKAGLAFYVDGNFIRSNNPTIRNGSLETNNPLRIGSRSSSVSSLFPGQIGEVTLYNKALKANVIKEQYTKGVSRSCF